MFQINDSIFQTPDPVWHETHLLDDKPSLFDHTPQEESEYPTSDKDFSIHERIIFKSGSILIRIGNGLVGKVEKPARKPQIV